MWSLVDSAWGRIRAYRYARGLPTYVNGERFILDARFGSPYGRHDPRDYEAPFYQAIMHAVESGMQVLDIGADIGLFTLGAVRRVAHGKVHAFEPNPERAAIIRRHLALNGVADRAVVIEEAVCDEVGPADFYISRDLPMAASFVRANAEFLSPSEAVPTIVQCTTLDAFVERSGVVPDVIKIDAEGAEMSILQGATQFLRKASPTIFCEVHIPQMERCGSSFKEFEMFVLQSGYMMERLSEPTMRGIFHARLMRNRH